MNFIGRFLLLFRPTSLRLIRRREHTLMPLRYGSGLTRPFGGRHRAPLQRGSGEKRRG
jgi:hypothetical protein